MSNVKKLEKAGVVKSRHLTEAHKAAIEKLSASEVKTLIGTRRKLARHLKGGAGAKAGKAGQPWLL